MATEKREMNIRRFDPAKASKAHNDTILASAFLPEGMAAPFDSAWGYLEDGSAMEPHSHPSVEIYVVIRGGGTVHVGDERQAIGPGDVIEIPPDVMHTVSCERAGPLLWAALWWAAEDGQA
jgi:mannose-6-phosphate isomerase-like protein (cupin superfamily)